MSVTIDDPTLIAALMQASDGVELKTPGGQLLGVFTADLGVPPDGVEPPFTAAELIEFEKQKSGRPLSDILSDLGKSL